MKPVEILLILSKDYPKCFDLQHPSPLKKGIYSVLKQTGSFKAKELFNAIRYYTRSTKYLESCQAGVCRIDLEGNPIPEEILTKEEAEFANSLLAKKIPTKKKKFLRPVPKKKHHKKTPTVITKRKRRVISSAA